MRTLLASVAALGLFLLPSCGDSSANSAVGTYTLDKAAFKQQMMAKMPADAPAQAKEMFDKMFDQMEGKLELKADNTAVFSGKFPDEGGGMKNETHTGTWKLEGNKISITTKDENGKDETKTGTYAAGVITVQMEEGGEKVTMTFKK